MNVKIVYYSGTGGTARVAKCFKKEFDDIGHHVFMQQLIKNVKIEDVKYELLILVYAVYAFNAPHAVDEWITEIKHVI